MDDVNGNERCHPKHIKPDADGDSHHKAARTSSLPERTCHSRPQVDDDGLSWFGKWQAYVNRCDLVKSIGRSIPECKQSITHEKDDQVARISRAVRTILESVGEDPNREGLQDTPSRYARALLFFTKSYPTTTVHSINIRITPMSTPYIRHTLCTNLDFNLQGQRDT
jgi:hypothetical protein